MSMNLTNPARLARSAAAIFAAAAFVATTGGCGSGDTMSDANTNSHSVVAQNTGTTNVDAAQYDTTRAFPTGDKGSSVLLVEATGPKAVRLNRDATSTVKVTNLTDMPVKNVMLLSTSPDGFKMGGVTGATAQPAADGGKSGYAVGDLGPKESKTVTITGQATKPGTIDTCYSVTFNPPTLCTNVDVTNPAIALAVDAPADVDICKPLTYTYTVTNTGTGVAKNVTLEEPLPDGLTTTDGKASVMAKLGDIPQGEKRSATAQLKPAKTGPFAGQATAKTDGEAVQPVATTTTVHAPVLTVDVAGGKSDYVGRQVPFTITVTNKGDATAMNAKVKVGHSSGMGKVTATGVDGDGNVAVGDLAPGASQQVTVNATSDQGGTVTVVAEASAMCAAAVTNSGQATFTNVPSILLETVDDPDPATVGQTITYTIKVTNQSAGPDTNVAVRAMVPDGETYVSTDGPTQPTADGATITFPTIATLGAKESVTWKVTVKAVKAGDVQFKSQATLDGVSVPAEKAEPTKIIGQ